VSSQRTLSSVPYGLLRMQDVTDIIQTIQFRPCLHEVSLVCPLEFSTEVRTLYIHIWLYILILILIGCFKLHFGLPDFWSNCRLHIYGPFPLRWGTEFITRLHACVAAVVHCSDIPKEVIYSRLRSCFRMQA
ncbi:hypothetical protein L9F63_008660, partial [Diploptera punctata]